MHPISAGGERSKPKPCVGETPLPGCVPAFSLLLAEKGPRAVISRRREKSACKEML